MVVAEELTHLTGDGRVHMVDVGDKPATVRWARAEGLVYARPEALEAVRAGTAAKGDVPAVTRVAAIMAAKRTAEIVPLCHPISLSGIEVTVEVRADHIRVEVLARAVGPTGVEMEALTAVSAACLTVYDMLKGLDRAMTIGPIRLLEKAGGRSGHFRREA
ncbi:MAG: cyclic pyranopterin monophosphate synthase MoaC [Actinomycetia bacterium]|nr:cyclic pyranopterin monophosphate synthase MoaC [Actinomycetes bacterium]